MLEVPAGHPEKPQGEYGPALLARMNGGAHEELALWGLSFVEIAADARIIDIGCGGGANIARLLERASRGQVTGVDYSPLSVQASRELNAMAIDAGQCEVVEGDAGALPFPDASFDVATAFETTYYWDLSAAFPEVLRVLEPGGRFLVCNEDDGLDAERLELASKIPGMVMHTANDLVAALEVAGFEIVERKERPDRGHLAIVAQRT